VIANPDDIARYQVEFYNLAKSVKGALGRGDVTTSGISNFEQLSSWARPRAASMPMTSTSS
jgi:general secretion pathway protein E